MTKEETINYPDGNKYVGEVSDGLPNGQGVMTYADDSTYVGEWKDGKWNGQGVYTWSDGTKFSGEWKGGASWNGTLCDKDGNVTSTYAEGVKKKGVATNVENMEWENGHYTGEVSSDGEPHGHGIMTDDDGTVYEGQWDTGTKQGQGTETHTDGSVYVGEWLVDMEDGTMTYADGSVYEGEWGSPQEFDMLGPREWHGNGTFTSSDGRRKYVGEWFFGKRHGHGTETVIDSENPELSSTYVGEWKDGEVWEGTETDKDGNVTATYSEGVETKK